MSDAHWQIVQILIVVETFIILGIFLHWVLSGIIQDYLVDKERKRLEEIRKEQEERWESKVKH